MSYCKLIVCNTGWRYAELDRALKGKDVSIVKLRESAQEREAELGAEIRNLTAKLEQSTVRIRQLEWSTEDLQKDKSSIVERYLW